MTTLSSASIVILATFIDKLFPHPGYKWLLYITLGGFVAAIVGGLWVFANVLDIMADRQRYGTAFNSVENTMVFMFIVFVVALVSLAAFFVANF